MSRRMWGFWVGVCCSVICYGPSLQAKPLKVYILAGQSNMQGHAQVRTLKSLADDPAMAELLAQLRQADGQPRVAKQVWVSSIGCQGDAYSNLEEQTGLLGVGFGAFGKSGDRFGPEFSFGLTLEDRLAEPILIIKTAWGGRSLHTDFRPPSAGPRVVSPALRKQWLERKQDPDQESRAIESATGVFYRHMIQHVRNVLANPRRVVPSYDEKQGYELAGLVWFQGWNDMVDSQVYPQRMQPGGYAEYQALLGHFIRDVRKDLSAPGLPVVIGVMGVGGFTEDEKAPQKHFRAAQRQVIQEAEFRGNVKLVETAPFWDEPLANLKRRWESAQSQINQEFKKNPSWTAQQKEEYRRKTRQATFIDAEWNRLETGVSNGDYHYLGAARIMAPIGQAMANALVPARQPAPQAPQATPKKPPEVGEMAGYLIVPHARVEQKFNAGFSMYVAAWPLLKQYPGQRFQSGLFGTWMFAQYADKKPEKIYSDIEGGLGWWRDTRFATETPKFIMGGVALNFVEWANGPGAGKGRDWNQPQGHYAVAQFSPWVLWPPDGLNLKQGTRGDWFGYGYLPLPLTAAKTETAGQPIPTGDQSWTLFLNTGNFKGPVSFFVPYFWSKPTLKQPELAGLFLDARPSDPNKAVQMETQHVPAWLGTDAQGVRYARIAPTQFPRSSSGETPLIHRITAYDRGALWDQVQAMWQGGPLASGRVDPSHAVVHKFQPSGGATWQIYSDAAKREEKVPVAWNRFATPTTLDETTYGYRWNQDFVTSTESEYVLPQYYRFQTKNNGKPEWISVRAEEVPDETGLKTAEFAKPKNLDRRPYVTPEDKGSPWKQPGPVAGPFRSKLGDGSTVTYYWYRFADQPALLNADLSAAEREELQKRVERLHRHWTKEREYLPPPTRGTLAELDPGVLVTPPAGLEIGYVPIVTLQGLE